jgi:hypothetical protein
MTEKYFRLWTSRVRSPSPALRINNLRVPMSDHVSVTSVKRQAHLKFSPFRIILSLITENLSERKIALFVTSSLASASERG